MKETIEIEVGTYAWAVAMEAQGKQVQTQDPNSGEWFDCRPRYTGPEDAGVGGWRLAPLSPVEALVAELKKNKANTADWPAIYDALAAVEAEMRGDK